MPGGAPEGKGDSGASGSGAGGSGGNTDEQQNGDMQVQHQQDQQVSVTGGDMYSVGFISGARAARPESTSKMT